MLQIASKSLGKRRILRAGTGTRIFRWHLPGAQLSQRKLWNPSRSQRGGGEGIKN